MPRYTYVALDAAARNPLALIEAATTNEAIGQLRRAGYFPTNVSRRKAPEPRPSQKRAKRRRLRGPSEAEEHRSLPAEDGEAEDADDLHPAARDADRCRAPFPPRPKRSRETGTRFRFQNTINELAESVQERQHIFRRSGAASAHLQQALHQHGQGGRTRRRARAGAARLAEFQEKAQKIKNKVVAAMAYPVIVLFIAMVIMALPPAFHRAEV